MYDVYAVIFLKQYADIRQNPRKELICMKLYKIMYNCA